MKNLSSAIRTARSVITANSPVLLVGTAIAGVVATGVLAAKGGYKARGLVDEAEDHKGEELTPTEKVQLTWLCYAAPVLTGASSIASIAGVHTIHTKRHAALAGLYAVTTGKLDDYQEQAEKMLGAKKAQQMNNEIAQKRFDSDPEQFENSEVIITGTPEQLCKDDWSGRWFMGSMNSIEAAINDINRQLVEDGDASLNEFYQKIGLDDIPMGASYGWSGTKLEARFGSVNLPDGRTALTYWFHTNPQEGFDRKR